MSFTTWGSQILVAGCQKLMFTIDVEKGTVLEKVRLVSVLTLKLISTAGPNRVELHHHEKVSIHLRSD